MSNCIGIDLGTTNSCVAVVENGEPVVISSSDGGRTTPSVVAFTKDGERIVGQAAKRQAAVNPQRTVYSIKREMGTDYRVKIDGKAYTPQEISAMILQKLRRDAEAFLGEPVSQAVITVPAYFTDSQRQATRDAGRIAGLDVLRIINEPTAAAFAYGLDHGQAQKILVYDLGGGTFDVSLIEIGDGVIEVLATSGDNHLGGDDFDERLADYLADEFKRTEKIDLKRDKAAMLRVREAAEKAKRELSGQMSTQVTLPFLTQDANGPHHLDVTVTRAQFEGMTRDLVERTSGPVQTALNDAGIHGATTVSSSGMAHALADAEDSHIIAAFRAFAASDRRESKTIFMVIEKAKRERVRRVVREKVGDLAQPDTGILFALPVTFADGLYETTTL